MKSNVDKLAEGLHHIRLARQEFGGARADIGTPDEIVGAVCMCDAIEEQIGKLLADIRRGRRG